MTNKQAYKQLKMKQLALLPNKEGFEFIAVLKNRNIVKSKIIKDENGLHIFPEFSNSIGWLDLKIKAEFIIKEEINFQADVNAELLYQITNFQ